MSDDAQVVEAVEVQEVPAEQVEEVVNEQPETEVKEETPQAKEDDVPIPKGVQKRIDRAVRRQYEAEAEAKFLRERLQMVAEQQQKPQAQVESAPSPDQFAGGEYDPEYIKAVAKYEAKAELRQQLEQHAKMVELQKAQAAQRQTVETWQQNVAKTTAELPDFADVVGSSNVPMPEHVKAVIMQSENGPKIAYYLATHQDEAEQIASQHPLAAIRALVRIEDKIEAGKTAKKATDAPAPINPVGSKAKAEKGPEEMSFSEFAEWRKRQIKNRR